MTVVSSAWSNRKFEPTPEDPSLRSMIGSSDTRFLLTVFAKSREEVLQRLEKLEVELNGLVKRDTVKGFDFAARYLPSAKLQKQRLAMIPPVETVRRNFINASKGMGMRVESFKPFFDSIKAVRQLEPLTYENMMETPLNLHIWNLLQPHEEGWLALVPLRRVQDKPGLIKWAKTEFVPGW